MNQYKSLRALLLVIVAVLFGGCVNVGGMMAEVLSDSVLNQRDPETVADGLPAYLLLLDGMILDKPKDQAMLLAGSRLYSAYSGAFVDDPVRARLMSATAMDYGRRALCLESVELCAVLDQPLARLNDVLDSFSSKSDAALLFSYSSVWASWIQANSGDWQTIAELPKVEAMMRKVLALDADYEQGSAHLYLGVLLCLRPASLGGQPEQGKEHFERAIDLSKGHNLIAKVLYARHYARLVFDQELHDRLLNEVLASEIEYPDLTLMNALAQRQAKELLEGSKDYF